MFGRKQLKDAGFRMKIFKNTLFALLAMTFSHSVFASSTLPFNNFFLFGDSLSDVGNNPKAPYTTPNASGARILWADIVASSFGVDLQASNNGGTDYAYAGSVSGALPSFVDTDGAHLMTDQVNTYLQSTGGHADGNALYSVWAGANDIMDAIASPTFDPTTDTFPLINASTGNVNTVVNQLHNAGANYIMVSNVPNIGATPAASNITFVQGEVYADAYNATIAAGGTVAQAIAAGQSAESFVTPATVAQIAAGSSALAQLFDQTLLGTLNSDGFNVIQMNTYGLLNAIQSNPQQYGFISADSSYCVPGVDPVTGAPVLNCSGNPNQDIFYDGLHPSQAAGLIIAEYDLSVLEAPEQIGILGQAPISVMGAQSTNIQNEVLGFITGAQKIIVDKLHVFATGATEHNSVDRATNQQNYTNNNNAFTVGGTYPISSQTLLGFAVGRSIGNVNFGGHSGGFDMDSNMLSGYLTYLFGQAYLTSETNYAYLNFSDVHRNFMLGPSPTTAMGATNGYQIAQQEIFGYNFDFDHITTGPVAELDGEFVHVNHYAEDGFAPWTMQYAAQNNLSLLGSLGWQIAYKARFGLVTLMPFLEATYNHIIGNPERNVDAGLVSLPGSQFSMPFDTPSIGYLATNGGIQAIFANGFTLSLTGQANIEQSQATSEAVMFTAGMAL